ncbi:MAG: hypothetical protein AVDCRST_MAG49-1235 [uncultured Thermomicrobiales bacterium]|uniref:Uncharacterized protein n=1 Tax=uncultured Thermomicrobiales bacterium TaxID=1645740 RepID=A0A6J4U9A7_9BACT|nr:MAG: hypothetical protein AVDCRST_MAG49-1235 [uncultured Thermomicrobiales bacterium]
MDAVVASGGRRGQGDERVTMGEAPVARDDETVRAGEDQGFGARFGAAAIAAGFGVEEQRVHNALQGEFGLGPDGTVDSKQAQQLAEALLGDQPLAAQEAALMQLGAFTPRRDDDWGMGDTAPGEESDRLSSSPDHPEDVTPSVRSSHDPSYTPNSPKG